MGWTVLHTAMFHSDGAVRTLFNFGISDSKTKDRVFASSLNPERWERVTGEVVDFDDTWTVPATMRQCSEDLAKSVIGSGGQCPNF